MLNYHLINNRLAEIYKIIINKLYNFNYTCHIKYLVIAQLELIDKAINQLNLVYILMIVNII